MRKWAKLEPIEKFNFLTTGLIKLSLLLVIPFSIYEQNWMAFFVSILTLILLFVPNLFEKKYKINLLAEFQLIIVVFLYASLFLGEVRGYYTRFWWWNSVLHFFSGLALGFAGFLILYILYKTGRFNASFKVIVVFSFCFAVALGVLWEIFEFGIDSFFGANMQRARNIGSIFNCNTRMGLMDTMWDLILNTVGAFLSSLAGYFYLKGGKAFILEGLIKKFEKKNPKLFKNNE
jgi:hypothetical protein